MMHPTTIATFAAPIVAPLDRVRTRLLHAFGPIARTLVVDREKRVTIVGIATTLLALVGAAFAPLWVLAIGPIVWGVPHLVADVRYLVVRPGLHRDRALWIAAGIPLVLAVFGGLWIAMLAVIGALIVTRGPIVKRAIGIAVAGSLALITWKYRPFADAAFVQIHNLVAVVLWWMWRPRKSRGAWLVLGAIAIGSMLIAGGAFDAIVRSSFSTGWHSPAHSIRLGSLADALAPGASTTIALRLVLLYAFGQSVHYAMWLRLIPEDDRERATPRPFAATLRALTTDLGAWLVAAAILATLALAAYALVDLRAARDGYLRFAATHGYLELVALAIRFAAARSPAAITIARSASSTNDRAPLAAAA